MATGTSSPPFYSLPLEVCRHICADLTNRDIKNLRLACRFLNLNCTLHFPRIFISANPVNVKAARCIAEQDAYRRQVVEIVWDDARLAKPKPQRTAAYRDISWSDEDDCPRWFAKACRDNLNRLEQYTDRDVDRPAIVERRHQLAHLMSLPNSWMAFLQMRFQEERVVETEADTQAFRYVLARCPVRIVTVTPAAHGLLFTPLYQTPMIRRFPMGFNYAIPRGWPTQWGHTSSWLVPPSWREAKEKVKNKWRGFRIVTRVLAEGQHNVEELRFDVHTLTTGLNSHIFDAPCDELADLTAVLARPGFRRLNLSLQVGGMRNSGWLCYRSGLLTEALGKAVDMEHFSLHADVTELDNVPRGWSPATDFVPLRQLFPIYKWPRLRHFGLSRFLVTKADLLSFLAALPDTLRTLELSNLGFLDDTSYEDLLELMRDTLGWIHRAPEARPRVSMTVDTFSYSTPGRNVWLDNEVNSFLYEGGDCPFEGRNNSFWEKGIMVDEFDASYRRPFVDNLELAKLGITTPDVWDNDKVDGTRTRGYAQADTDDELYEIKNAEYPEEITVEMRERQRAKVRQREARKAQAETK